MKLLFDNIYHNASLMRSPLWLLANKIYLIFLYFVPPTVDVQGRPKGVTAKFSLAPLVPRLSELLGIQVHFAFTVLKLMLVYCFIYADEYIMCT